MNIIDVIKDYNDVKFKIKDTPCGVAVEVYDRIPTYQSWCGRKNKEYKSLDELIKDHFFCGKSLEEISETIEYWCI